MTSKGSFVESFCKSASLTRSSSIFHDTFELSSAQPHPNRLRKASANALNLRRMESLSDNSESALCGITLEGLDQSINQKSHETPLIVPKECEQELKSVATSSSKSLLT